MALKDRVSAIIVDSITVLNLFIKKNVDLTSKVAVSFTLTMSEMNLVVVNVFEIHTRLNNAPGKS